MKYVKTVILSAAVVFLTAFLFTHTPDPSPPPCGCAVKCVCHPKCLCAGGPQP